MNGKLFLSSKQRGRFGNQLFRLHMALQVSNYISAPISLPRNSYTRAFKLSGVRLLPGDSFRNKKAYVNLEVEDFLANKTSILMEQIRNHIYEGRIVTIPVELLGEKFYEYSFKHPSELLQFKKCKDTEEQEPTVALHYRGKDFSKWNPLSIMEPAFYLSCLESLRLNDLSITIYTDDPDSFTVNSLKKLLPDSKLFTGGTTRDAFVSMSRHKFIIASPSTFSFWAALLGPSSTLAISQTWVNEMSSLGDNFWPRIATNERKFFDRVVLV